MRKRFTDRYSLLSGVNKAVLMDMYQHLTGDVSSILISQGVQDRLQLVLDSQDPDVCFDLRHHNTGRPETFEDFRKAVEGILNENAVDSRQHGVVCHMALALSVRDPHNKVLAKHPTIIAPSIEWLRYQFCPQNEFNKSSLRYTGRLKIKYMVVSPTQL